MTPDQLLELTAPETASVEKQLATDVKIIRFAIKGNERARNLFFAYAAIAGARANHIMEISAHGEGEKLLAKEFPQCERTLQNWREFASVVQEKMIAKSATVALLTAPPSGKKAPSAKAAEAVQEAVLEVMDGQGMVEFMRACKALKEPELLGGDRGSNGRKTPTAEEQRKAAEEYIGGRAIEISELARDQANLPLCSRPILEKLADAALALREAIESIKKERKTK